MAGNLVKWWKHKILGGYKQFSVQECTTDSEELMYHQVRASSSCSAPPDLLLVSDRENNIPLRSPVVNIMGTTTTSVTKATSPSAGINACHLTSATNNNQRHNQKLLHQQQQQQQQQQQHHVSAQHLSLAYNGTKDIGANGKQQKQLGIGSSSHGKHGQQQDCQQQQPTTTTLHDIEGQMEAQPNNHSSARHAHHTQYQQQHQQQQRSDEHIRLEEFTCDVSVEGGKSTQPLQFSFTFYDLDGHHGKITKDDIVGIVYTIYESIGKSVVVPHSGSKTINVRLTVSPEGKSKTAKNKKTSSGAVVLDTAQKTAPLAPVAQAARRLHRYRPRKLIKSDEEDDDSNSDKERENTHANNSNLSQALAHKSAVKSHKSHKLKVEQQCCSQPQSLPPNTTEIPNSPLEIIYDNLKPAITPDSCKECLAAVDESRLTAISPTVQYPASKTTTPNEAYMKHVASSRMKMLRKSRKQKHQDCMETRQRSLSVGNEACLKNRHLQKQQQQQQQQTQQQILWHAEQQLNCNGADVVDGVQLRNPLKVSKMAASAQKRNSAECWKTALNRNDLISIIRESMEKNRLCFQLNGKPQANVSPIRHSQSPQIQHHQQHLAQQQHNNTNKHPQQLHTTTATVSQHRQRSNTVSKIPTLIANHNNVHSVSPQQQSQYPTSAPQRSSSCANTISNNNDTNLHEQPNSTNSSNNIYHHLQPHIPIYHQQLAINPAVIAAHKALLNGGSGSAAGHHGKMNLCGYDSFLHATICGGGLSHSPPPQNSLASQQVVTGSPTQNSVNQQIATVQPIMSSNGQSTNKPLSLAVTPNQIKTSKILRSGSFVQTQHQLNTQVHSTTAQNSPQYHGYQRLPSSSKHNLSAMHLISPTMEKPPLEQLEKWRRDQVKNYDQLLYAKLSEKLAKTNLVSSNPSARESNLRRKQRALRHRRAAGALISEANNVILNTKICPRDDSDYAAMINIEGDAVECENLLGQTSDEENQSQQDKTEQGPKQLLHENASTRHVAEGTLVVLDDVVRADDHTLNADPLLTRDTETHELHLEADGLVIEDDFEEVLDEELQADGVLTGSGRNSAVSNDSNINPEGATLANTTGNNTSITSSSLIHRYVHEHIHHHYHHFEDKEE